MRRGFHHARRNTAPQSTTDSPPCKAHRRWTTSAPSVHAGRFARNFAPHSSRLIMLVVPVMAVTAPPIGTSGGLVDTNRTYPFNLAGIPSLVVPAGFDGACPSAFRSRRRTGRKQCAFASATRFSRPPTGTQHDHRLAQPFPQYPRESRPTDAAGGQVRPITVSRGSRRSRSDRPGA
jgi:hypothetical protein